MVMPVDYEPSKLAVCIQDHEDIEANETKQQLSLVQNSHQSKQLQNAQHILQSNEMNFNLIDQRVEKFDYNFFN